MKLLNYIITLLIIFFLVFITKAQTKDLLITRELLKNDSLEEINKNILINNNFIKIIEDNKYQNFNIVKREVIPSYEDEFIYDIYYSSNNELILKLIINPYFGDITEVIISYDNNKTFHNYKIKKK